MQNPSYAEPFKKVEFHHVIISGGVTLEQHSTKHMPKIIKHHETHENTKQPGWHKDVRAEQKILNPG